MNPKNDAEGDEAWCPEGLAVDDSAVIDRGSEYLVSALPDLTDLDLEDLMTEGRPVLVDAVRRIRDEIVHPEGAVAGFHSSL